MRAVTFCNTRSTSEPAIDIACRAKTKGDARRTGGLTPGDKLSTGHRHVACEEGDQDSQSGEPRIPVWRR
jgi:hypothetical protein